MGILPADGQSFVDLEILTGFDAAAAENALVGIVTIKRVGVIDFVGLGFEWEVLVLDGKHLRGVVNDTVAIVVVTYRAIQKVIRQNAVKRFRSRGPRQFRRSKYGHVLGNRRRTGAHQLAVDFHKARVAGLDGAELLVIADMRKLYPGTVDHVNETISYLRIVGGTINENRHLSERRSWRCTLVSCI